jgi:hypothetical protein
MIYLNKIFPPILAKKSSPLFFMEHLLQGLYGVDGSSFWCYIIIGTLIQPHFTNYSSYHFVVTFSSHVIMGYLSLLVGLFTGLCCKVQQKQAVPELL